MATMYIAEYERQARDSDGHVLPVGEEPALKKQAVSFTATHGASATFLDATRFVRVSLDAAGFVTMGAAPVAVSGTDTPMAANVPEYFGVRKGMKISAVV